MRKDGKDPRYFGPRWRRVRLVVLARDNYTCWVNGCPQYANVCDHILPVYPAMPDSEFFALSNLRASCKRHNTARGVAARLERETAEGIAPAPSPYVFGARRGPFLGGAAANNRPLVNLHTQKVDYSRKRVTRGVG